MIPILYDKTETAFTSLGLGMLAEAISCEVSQTLNGAYELTMQYPQSGARFADLCNERIIKATAEKGKSAQLFTIYCITKPINGVVTVNASHISGRKEYIPVMTCSATSVSDALVAIKTNSAETNPFTFWTNKSTVANFAIGAPRSLGQALGGMAGSILDVYGGEYEFDNFTIKLWNHRGADNGVSLRYGKNITDFQQEENIASTITGICPFWADSEGNTIVLPEKTVDSPNAANFAFKRTVVQDFSTVWQTQPTEAQLRAYAQAYVAQAGIGVPKVSITLKFENLADYEEYKDYALLEAVQLGDTVHVYFEPLDATATARVVKTRYNSLMDKYTSIDIGSVKANMSTVIADVETHAEEQTSASINYLEEAFDKAIKDLSGAEGGNVVIRTDGNGKPYEILIMDTDDVTTAVKVLRLNQNGLGYSTNGIAGAYTVAMTGNGIIADSITAGKIEGIKIIGEEGSIGGWKMDVNDISKSQSFDYSAVDITYLATIYSYMQGLITLEEAIQRGADIDGDGKVNWFDMELVRMLILGYISQTGTAKVLINSANPFSTLAITDGDDTVFEAGIHGMYAPSAYVSRLVGIMTAYGQSYGDIAIQCDKLTLNGKRMYAMTQMELLASTNDYASVDEIAIANSATAEANDYDSFSYFVLTVSNSARVLASTVIPKDCIPDETGSHYSDDTTFRDYAHAAYFDASASAHCKFSDPTPNGWSAKLITRSGYTAKLYGVR